MKIKALVYLLGGLLFASCGNSSRSDSEYVPVTDYSTIEDSEEDGSGGYEEYLDAPIEWSSSNSKEIRSGTFTNICSGNYFTFTNVAYEYLDENNETQNDTFSGNMRIMHLDYPQSCGKTTFPAHSVLVNDPGWNVTPEGGENSGGASRSQIEAEIARHEENIAQLEGMLEYIDGSVNRTQIQQQIIDEKYEIRRLKNMLNESQ